ncbi:MAG: hypothetical protein KA752_02100 [Giesbergeria sp.]|nr:hypothetical protein [Giesbergeria sp.]
MAKPSKNEWAAKVLTLVKAGNLQAALAQTKVAPTAGDVERLQAMMTALPKTAALLQFQKAIEEERALLAAPRLHRSP